MSTNYSDLIEQRAYPDFTQVPAEQHATGHAFNQHLRQLTTYSAPQIQNLTAFCVENRDNFLAIVKVMEHAIFWRPPSEKLVLFALMDSILKVAGEPFIYGFDQNMVSTWCDAYDECTGELQGGELCRQMRELLKGWENVFGPALIGDLYKLASETEAREAEYMFEDLSQMRL